MRGVWSSRCPPGSVEASASSSSSLANQQATCACSTQPGTLGYKPWHPDQPNPNPNPTPVVCFFVCLVASCHAMPCQDIPGGPVLMESRYTQAGREMSVCGGSPAGSLGLSTCYDLRFPEMYTCLAKKSQVQITVYACTRLFASKCSLFLSLPDLVRRAFALETLRIERACSYK